MICLKNKTIKNYFQIVWQYVSLILSDYFLLRNNRHYNRSFAAIWLLICNVLLASYSGHLWDVLVRPQAIDKIDSWDDLYTKPQWNKLKIRTPEFLDMADFAMYDKSEMAQNFKKRIILINPFDFLFDENLGKTAFEAMMSGEEVNAADELLLHYYKSFHKHSPAKKGFDEGFDYHISESGSGLKPYFIVFNERIDGTLTKKLNDMYVFKAKSFQNFNHYNCVEKNNSFG
jgi:hypothetical protein